MNVGRSKLNGVYIAGDIVRNPHGDWSVKGGLVVVQFNWREERETSLSFASLDAEIYHCV